MIKFILRRLGISALVLFGGSVLMYFLTVHSGDPLEDLRESNNRNRDVLIAQRVRLMELDLPWYERYLSWLKGVGGCFVGNCDLGVTRQGTNVIDLIQQAAVTSLRLVFLATIIAIVVGIAAGILAALRQYSGFDYTVTFGAFVLFSLPVFWAAVLMKDYIAIRFNKWIKDDPSMSIVTILVLALVIGFVVQSIAGGSAKRRLVTGGVMFVVTFGVLFYFESVNWWTQPALGPGIVAAVGLATAVVMTILTTGLSQRRVLYSGLTTALVGTLAVVALSGIISKGGYLMLFLLFLVSMAVAVIIGIAWGGYVRKIQVWVNIVVAFAVGLTAVIDQAVSHFASLMDIKGLLPIIPTVGDSNIKGKPLAEFWEVFLDQGLALVLPTILLALVSIASYSRYARASMLETLQQDYVRTARSKGLSERTVITKHALRNALIPLTTIIAFDFANLISGAVLTETVFGWKGMGDVFKQGLDQVDPAPVMAFYLVTGTAAVVMNMVADIAYGFLDPRIRR